MISSGIVLCGGRSTRMGRDKALLPFGDEPMLARVVRLVGEVTDDVVVVARADQALPAEVDKPKGLSLRVVRDAVDDLGPLAGMVTGLKAIRNDRAFVTACDMPLLRPALIRRLIDLAGDHDVCVPVSDARVMTMCAVYRRSVMDEADRLIRTGELSVKGLIDRVNARRVDAAALRDVDPELESFVSCDTPERYAQAIRMSGAP